MRKMTGFVLGGLAITMVFGSCTCHKDVSEPPAALTDRPSGFHAESATTPKIRAAAPTVTPAAQAEQAPSPAAQV